MSEESEALVLCWGDVVFFGIMSLLYHVVAQPCRCETVLARRSNLLSLGRVPLTRRLLRNVRSQRHASYYVVARR